MAASVDGRKGAQMVVDEVESMDDGVEGVVEKERE
jgi:hypothetical protein